MIHLDPGTTWIFIVDTDQYAGNFERQMCAYMTGQVGDCGVGEKEARAYGREVGDHLDFVVPMPDEHGCFRPCSAWRSAGRNDYHSVAIFCDGMPNGQARRLLASRAKKYCELHGIKFLGVRMQVHAATLSDLAFPSDGSC